MLTGLPSCPHGNPVVQSFFYQSSSGAINASASA